MSQKVPDQHEVSLDVEEWVSRLRNVDMPDWGNVDGTKPGRVSDMDLDNVIDRWVSEDDIVLEVGCSKGYTSSEIANISEAEVVGVDVPEVYSNGIVENKHGRGPSPQYFSAVAPVLPFKEGSVEGVAALNSLTYLCRNIGKIAVEREQKGNRDRENVQKEYTQEAITDMLDELNRVTADKSYVILGEQTDHSYLVLEKDDSEWQVEDYNSMDRRNGKSMHIRYRPWIQNEKVNYLPNEF